MRTILLLALTIAIGLTGFAQKRPAPGKIALKPAIDMSKLRTHPNEVPIQQGTTRQPKMPVKSTNMIEMIPIGSSLNAYSVLYPTQRCMDYNAAADVIMATHRGDPVTPGFATGNDIVTVYSTDQGATWEETIGFLGSTSKRSRYPSGQIYNPAGNTDPENVYSVTAGPVTDGTNWTFCYYGSVTKAGANVGQYWEPTTMGELLYSGLSVTDNGIAAIGETNQTNDGNGYTGLFGFTEIGNFNGTTNAFDWTLQTWDPQEFVYYDATNGWYRSWSSSYQMCFSKDGSVGYKWTDGVDNRATNGSSFYPIVYKTTDGGATWNVLDYFDFGYLPDVYQYMYNIAAENRVAPWIRSSDGVVDYMGNLHMIVEATSAVSVHPDSLTYYWTGDYGSIFEFIYENSANVWMANWIDTLETDDPTGGTSGNSIYGTGADKEGWDKRVQASISPDGRFVFATWTDTDDYMFWGLSEPLNMYPDIKLWARDIESNMHSFASNLTYEGGAGAAWGACYYSFTSHTAIDAGDRFILPTSIVDIATNGYDPTLPVFHFYLKDIEFSRSEFIMLGENEASKAACVVGNLSPNVVSGLARFSVSLTKASNVTVTVSTITGQEVSATNYGKLASGNHSLEVDGSNLGSGIYILAVTVDGQKYTQKFVVK